MIDNYEMIKITSLLLILFSVIIIALAIVFVHTMPGKIARSRNHPQAEAIEITSLLGLLIFPLWMASLIWAYIKPTQPALLAHNYPENTEIDSPTLADKESENSIQKQNASNKKIPQAQATLNTSLSSYEETDSSIEGTADSNSNNEVNT